MSTKRSKFLVEVTVETRGLSDEEHNQRARWAYRNMATRNGDMQDTFLVISVRDEQGDLLEFSGSGRGKPSPEIQSILDQLILEEQP